MNTQFSIKALQGHLYIVNSIGLKYPKLLQHLRVGDGEAIQGHIRACIAFEDQVFLLLGQYLLLQVLCGVCFQVLQCLLIRNLKFKSISFIIVENQ